MEPNMADGARTSDRYLVPGLVRGLQILRAFRPERANLTLGDIAQVLKTTRSAAFRTVYTLVHMGCLLHDERRLTYSLGPAVLTLGYGYIATRELVELAQPDLERLRDESGWSAHLAVLDGTAVLYMLRVPSLQSRSSIVHVGSRLPARSTTLGRMAAVWSVIEPWRALWVAVAVLIVTCPCALSLATPSALLAAAMLGFASLLEGDREDLFQLVVTGL
eukprot:gene38318-51755_t